MAVAAWLLFAMMCSLSLAGMGLCGSLNRPLVKSPSRSRRSDDVDPLTAVVNQLSQEVLQLKTSLAALEASQARLAGSQTMSVSFTVHFSKADVVGLGTDQILVFDVARNNIGNGYNTGTGFFTAPVAGSYVFFLGMQRHGDDESTFIASIVKGTTTIGVTEAGYSPFEHGSMLVTTHLERGDTVCVKASHGTTVYGGMSTVFSGFLLHQN